MAMLSNLDRLKKITIVLNRSKPLSVSEKSLFLCKWFS